MGILSSSNTRLKFLTSILALNVGRLRHPFKISWAVTYRCNLKCQFCNIWQRRDEQPELSVEEADRFFFRAKKFSWVGLTGGEPFLRADLDDIVDSVVHRSERLEALHINTNGWLAGKTADFAERFRSRHPRIRLIITVSLDGPPAVHDELRGVPGSWNRATELFAALKRISGVKAQAGFTLSHMNMDSFIDTFESLHDAYPGLRHDDVNVNIFQQSGIYYDNQQMTAPDPESIRQAIDRILAYDRGPLTINNYLRRTYLRYYKKFLVTGKSPLPCQALSASCFVNPYGDLYPCIMYDRFLLNIRDLNEDLEGVWWSEKGKKIRHECYHQHCQSCWSPCDAFSAIAGSLAKTLIT